MAGNERGAGRPAASTQRGAAGRNPRDHLRTPGWLADKRARVVGVRRAACPWRHVVGPYQPGLLARDGLAVVVGALPHRTGRQAVKELDGELVLRTERLLVRRWSPDDLEPLLRVYGDAEAMRWVGDGVALTPQQAANWLEVTANNYRQRGYGMYT